MAALLALHVDHEHGIDRRHQPKRMKDEAEDEARHDQEEIEDRVERLAVQQEPERRQKDREQMDHGLHPLAAKYDNALHPAPGSLLPPRRDGTNRTRYQAFSPVPTVFSM